MENANVVNTFPQVKEWLVALIWTPWLQALCFSLCLHTWRLLQHPALFNQCLGQNSVHWRSCQILCFISASAFPLSIWYPLTLTLHCDNPNSGSLHSALWNRLYQWRANPMKQNRFSAERDSAYWEVEFNIWQFIYKSISVLNFLSWFRNKNIFMCLQIKNLDVFAVLNLTHLFFLFLSASLHTNLSQINSQLQRCPKLQWTFKNIKSEGKKTVLSLYCRLGIKSQKDKA